MRDALLALQDAWDDQVALGDVRLAVAALNCELTNGRQRLLLAVLLYELADAFTRATA